MGTNSLRRQRIFNTSRCLHTHTIACMAIRSDQRLCMEPIYKWLTTHQQTRPDSWRRHHRAPDPPPLSMGHGTDSWQRQTYRKQHYTRWLQSSLPHATSARFGWQGRDLLILVQSGNQRMRKSGSRHALGDLSKDECLLRRFYYLESRQAWRVTIRMIKQLHSRSKRLWLAALDPSLHIGQKVRQNHILL